MNANELEIATKEAFKTYAVLVDGEPVEDVTWDHEAKTVTLWR